MAQDKPIQLELFGQEDVFAPHNLILTNAACEKVAAEYLSGKKVVDLSSEWGVHPTSIYNALKRKGISRSQGKPATRLTQELANKLIEMLANGMSQRNAYRAFGLSSMTYYDWINKGRSGFSQLHIDFALAIDNVFSGAKPQARAARKYTLSENYFREIDTPEKAWMLGFIATDGNVMIGNNSARLKIKVAIRDKEILEKIRVCLGSNAPIVIDAKPKDSKIIANGKTCTVRSSGTATVTFSSEPLIADLGRHGIHPDKTFTIHPWNGSLDLRVHYWAGALDGDGALSRLHRRNDGTFRWQMNFCGNLAMATGFAAFIEEAFGYRPRVYPHGTIFSCSITSLPLLQEICKQFYPNDRIVLARKFSIAGKIMATELKKISAHPITREELIVARQRSLNWADTARLLGIPGGTISELRNRLGVPKDIAPYRGKRTGLSRDRDEGEDSSLQNH